MCTQAHCDRTKAKRCNTSLSSRAERKETKNNVDLHESLLHEFNNKAFYVNDIICVRKNVITLPSQPKWGKKAHSVIKFGICISIVDSEI